MEDKSLASEMLGELKLQNKRTSILLIIMVILWFGTIGLFVWYINQYEYADTTTDTLELETSTQDNSSGDINISGNVDNG